MKRPWLAALLNAWPLPLGLGYLYLRHWARFVVSFLWLQVIASTVVLMLVGRGELLNLFSVVIWIAVVVDAYQLAQRTNRALQATGAVPPPQERDSTSEPEATPPQLAEVEAPSPPVAPDAATPHAAKRWGLRVLLAVGTVGVLAGVVLMATLYSILQPHAPAPPETAVTPPTYTPTPLRTATPPPISTSAPPLIIYTVQPGDTLSSIAARFGTTVDAIMDLNGLVSATIHPGTGLRIPSSGQSVSASPRPTELPTLPLTPTPLPTSATPDDEYIACLGQVADLSEQLNQQLDAAWAAGHDRETFCQSWLSYDLLANAQSAQQVHNACATPQHSDLIEARGLLDRALEYRVASVQLITDWCIAGTMDEMEDVFEESERYMRLANEFIDKATSAMRGP